MSTPPAPTLMSSSSLYDYHLLVPPPSSQPPPQTHLKLILITILVFSVITIVITFLYLLFRHLHSISTSSDQSTPSHRSAAAVTPLPLFTFSSVFRNSGCDSDCAICLSKFHPRDKLRLLPLCCHAFHAVCIDTWLRTTKTCPLCRSSIHATDSNIAASLQSDSAAGGRSGSFRLEIGSVRRQDTPEQGNAPTAYSIGSFQYIVDGESEVIVSGHHRSVSVKDESGPVDSSVARDASGERNWLGDYVDRLSATLSYSRSFFTGSSRRIEVGEWPELDGSRVGEEISEWFRWASGV